MRSRLLVPAAATCGLLWVGAVLVAGRDIQGQALILLCGAGVLATVVLLLIIQRQHTKLRGLAGTDALTGLVNHRSFHETLGDELRRVGDQPRPGDREPVRVGDPGPAGGARRRRRGTAAGAQSERRARNSRLTDSGRPHIWTISARPSCTSRTISSPAIP